MMKWIKEVVRPRSGMAIAADTSAYATGTLVYCRVSSRGTGADDLLDGEAGTSGSDFNFNTLSIVSGTSGSDFNFNTLSIVSGTTGSMSTFTVSVSE